jgi:hypothetical protein
MAKTLTYAGVFDDQVYRYPGYFGQSVGADKTKRNEFFNELLLRSLYFGRPLAINDGYMLQHPFLTDSVRNRNSFLRVLARNGYVVLLRRNPSEPLSKLTEWAMTHNVGSIAAVPKSQTKEQWHLLAAHLDDFEREVKLPNQTRGGVEIGVKRWPNRDTAQAFNNTMKALLDADSVPTDLLNEGRFEYERIKHAFNKYVRDPGSVVRSGKIPAPRTFWERLVKIVYREDGDDRHIIQNPMGKRFMEVANCVYHFNFAATFDAQNERFDISTPAESTALNFCLGPQQIDPNRKAIPEVRIPKDLFKANPALIEDFLANQDLLDAKDAYLSAVDHYLDTCRDYEQLKDATANYSKHLNKFTLPESAKILKLETLISVFFGSVTTAIEWPGKPPMDATVGGLCTILSMFGAPAVLRLIRIADSRSVQSAIGGSLDSQMRSRQLFLRPAGEHYKMGVDTIRTLPELFKK